MTNKEYKTDAIYCIGDVHGDYTTMNRHLSVIEDSLVIQLGDFGLGFRLEEKELRVLRNIDKLLIQNNNRLLVIRGNHDNPVPWNDEHKYNSVLKNIYFVPDYTEMQINNTNVLFVGGATSIDRVYRTEGSSYWKDEKLATTDKNLNECGVLITHTCPSYHNNRCDSDDGFLKGFLEKDELLLDELIEERSIVDKLISKTKPHANFHGHFHNTDTQTIDGCYYRTFDIDECDDVTPYFQ